ncbi:PEP-CTERM sorting domain-containing protein [Alteromonas gracilis]|uniref:PEP-CTERM sorting domain-containing protein n=1 Tax=Alteromonas gracilis TaxID=1479524 RepID=UPI0037367B14
MNFSELSIETAAAAAVPTTIALLSIGLIGVGFSRKKKASYSKSQNVKLAFV